MRRSALERPLMDKRRKAWERHCREWLGWAPKGIAQRQEWLNKRYNFRKFRPFACPGSSSKMYSCGTCHPDKAMRRPTRQERRADKPELSDG